MPTFASLIAAICLSITAFLASRLVIEAMPDGTDFGIFLPLNMAIGFVTGWSYTGALAGRGLAEAISYGLTGAAILTFAALFAQSANEMLELALRHRYGGPFEAIAAIFSIGVGHAVQFLTIEILTVLALGGLAAGVLANFASWKGK